VEGESGGRHSGIASPARLNWSRTVNWSLSARRMASNSASSGFHSSIPLSRSRCPRWGSRASRQAERQLPSRKLLQVMRGEPAPRHESLQLDSRLHAWQEGRSGFRLWRSRAATFGYPVSTYFGAGRHFADSFVGFQNVAYAIPIWLGLPQRRARILQGAWHINTGRLTAGPAVTTVPSV
jgi:hypothetical protein